MAIILTKLVDQALVIIDDPLIASGDVNENQVHFEFDSSWIDYTEKHAIFYQDKKKPYIESVNSNGCSTIPKEAESKSGSMHFGVIGRKSDGTLRTSQLVKYKIFEGTPTEGNEPSRNGVAIVGLDNTLTREGMAADAKAVGDMISSINGGGTGNYVLPIATNSKLGGVKPVSKTSSMTQNVGVDAEGRLYTAPVGGTNITVDSSLSNSSTNPLQNKVVYSELNKRVNKEDGKGLSSNDFTDEYKEKVDLLIDDYEAILGVL